MSKLNKGVRREKKRQAKREMKEKIGMFNKIPDHCLVCEEPFDKKNKKMVLEWFVIVKNESKTVRLYCPDCWSRANNLLSEWKGKIEEGDSNDENIKL
tara:strand:- start:838 stop:1131 length:294 start_codon:yes stop_codon:yes gene_type:complete